MKKVLIVGINGSPRKNGMTAKELKRVLDAVEEHGGESVLIHLTDKKIKPCIGCYSIDHTSCVYPCRQKDDMQEIYKILLKANGIVFATPVYWFNVSGLMKNFIDRLTCLECSGFLLEGKIAGFIAATKEDEGGRLMPLLNMAGVMSHMGMIIPPYSLIFYPGIEENKNWAVEDTKLLGKNMVMLAKLLKDVRTGPEFNKKLKYSWGLK